MTWGSEDDAHTIRRPKTGHADNFFFYLGYFSEIFREYPAINLPKHHLLFLAICVVFWPLCTVNSPKLFFSWKKIPKCFTFWPVYRPFLYEKMPFFPRSLLNLIGRQTNFGRHGTFFHVFTRF